MPLHANRLTRAGLMAKAQWKKHAPKLYAALQKSGKLHETLHKAQEQAGEQFGRMIDQGSNPHEAQREAFSSLQRFDPENDPAKEQPWEEAAAQDSAVRAAKKLLSHPAPSGPRVQPSLSDQKFLKERAHLKVIPRLVTREEISGMTLPPTPKVQPPEVPAPAWPLTLKPSVPSKP